ncbi:MAG: acyl--CoA ligase [Oscillospiraceae bacterium]|nr:acyl--CoA ligase [Oscillospiraceae bacterium]
MEKSAVKTLQDLVRLSAEEYGDKDFVREKASPNDIVSKSFKQFYEDCRRLAAFLKARSAGETLHAAVIGPTSYAYLVGYFGTVLGGNVIVPLDAQLAPADICELLNRSDSTVFYYDSKFAPMLPAVKANCPAVKTCICLQETEDGSASIPSLLTDYEPAELSPIPEDALASIVYTSGTTGKAKGVMLAHSNLVDNAMCQDGESTSEDVIMSVLPIHHIYCFTCDVLLSIRYGTTLCVNDSMLRIPQNLKLFKPTIMLLVPMIAATIYKQIQAGVKANPDIPPAAIAKTVFGGRLKGIYSGGAYLDPSIVKGYTELGIPIAQGYGMTECSPRISTANFNEEVSLRGDVGKIVNGCEVKIVDGEIRAKSPSVMKGYYKDPEETAAALTEDGWLCTGDLGYVEDGRIFITGRKKNLIILSNGENVSPEEIENKFVPVDIAGEVLVYAEDGVIFAEVFPNPELAAKMSKDEIVSALNEAIKKINTGLTSAKTIRGLRIRDKEFEKTTSKKIKRQQTEKGEQVRIS